MQGIAQKIQYKGTNNIVTGDKCWIRAYEPEINGSQQYVSFKMSSHT